MEKGVPILLFRHPPSSILHPPFSIPPAYPASVPFFRIPAPHSRFSVAVTATRRGVRVVLRFPRNILQHLAQQMLRNIGLPIASRGCRENKSVAPSAGSAADARGVAAFAHDTPSATLIFHPPMRLAAGVKSHSIVISEATHGIPKRATAIPPCPNIILTTISANYFQDFIFVCGSDAEFHAAGHFEFSALGASSRSEDFKNRMHRAPPQAAPMAIPNDKMELLIVGGFVMNRALCHGEIRVRPKQDIGDSRQRRFLHLSLQHEESAAPAGVGWIFQGMSSNVSWKDRGPCL